METRLWEARYFSDVRLHWTKKGHGYMHRWYNHDVDEDRLSVFDVILNNPQRVDDSYTLIYEDVIKAYPFSIE